MRLILLIFLRNAYFRNIEIFLFVVSSIKKKSWKFPGSPGVRTAFSLLGPEFDPCLGNYNPTSLVVQPKRNPCIGILCTAPDSSIIFCPQRTKSVLLFVCSVLMFLLTWKNKFLFISIDSQS